MRILTWNINGVRTIPQYHPWNTMKTHNEILDNLHADIICFQEMKSSRPNLPKAVGLPSSYHSFFSFPLHKNGYSGVAVYARTDSALRPLKAEEGLAGVLQPKPPLSDAERVSRREAYPEEVLGDDDAESELDLDFRALDSEGRALVIDFGLFVLVNVYCPNDGTDTAERTQYKMDFHRTLEARVRGLVEVERREVLVVGDLNACAAVVDHCEGHIMVARGQAEGLPGDAGFWGHGARGWLRDWLISEDEPGNRGVLVDVVRRFWPDRKAMYTCWNTKISARESNYGTRIDYILATPGLLPWIKAADIQPEIKGSDHCPVFVDLYEEIHSGHGDVVLRLRDVLGPGARGPGAEPPRIAARFWEEYKQRMLDAFFGRKMGAAAQVEGASAESPSTKSRSAVCVSAHEPTTRATSSVSTASQSQPTPSPPSPSPPTRSSATPPVKRKISSQEPVASNSSSSSSSKKRLKKDNDDGLRVKLKKGGQTKLASFFSKPPPPPPPPPQQQSGSQKSQTTVSADDTLDADYKLALSLSQLEEADPGCMGKGKGKSKNTTTTSQAWTSLLAPIQPPRCIVHGEPAKELTVNKPGPNRGKNFFVCARPVGPGYDRGKGERLREEVDPQWRCDFFRWSSEVRLEMIRGGAAAGVGKGGHGHG